MITRGKKVYSERSVKDLNTMTRTAPGTWKGVVHPDGNSACIAICASDGLVDSDHFSSGHTTCYLNAPDNAAFIVLADHHFDALEKALRQLVDRDITYDGRQVVHGIHVDDIGAAREVLAALEKERAKYGS